MESSTLVVSLLLVVVILIPFIIMRGGIKKRAKLFLAELKAFASEHNADITDYDLSKDIAIGRDEAKGLVFFIHHGDELKSAKKIDLNETKNVQLTKGIRRVVTEHSESTIIEKVGLAFVTNATTVNFEFFNTDSGSLTMSGELQLAEKWEELLKLNMLRCKNIKN